MAINIDLPGTDKFPSLRRSVEQLQANFQTTLDSVNAEYKDVLEARFRAAAYDRAWQTSSNRQRNTTQERCVKSRIHGLSNPFPKNRS